MINQIIKGHAMTRVLAIFSLLILGGCVTDGVGPSNLVPVCDALIGPIKYNSSNPASARHAGKVLAKDLKLRNTVGKKLSCPQYK